MPSGADARNVPEQLPASTIRQRADRSREARPTPLALRHSFELSETLFGLMPREAESRRGHLVFGCAQS
jgi:hypothetical protein